MPTVLKKHWKLYAFLVPVFIPLIIFGYLPAVDAFKLAFIDNQSGAFVGLQNFIDMASDLRRKVIALLDQVFPEYEKLFSDTFGASSMEILSQYTTPEEMLSVSSQQLAEVLEKASRGRLGVEKS